MAYRCAVLMGWCLLLLVVDWNIRPPALSPAQARLADQLPASAGETLQRHDSGHIPMPTGVPSAHASTLLAMPEGLPWSVVALWFAGSKEAAPDVQIMASRFERASGQWTAAEVLIDRLALAQQLGFGITRLGNPVAWFDAQNRLHVMVVATGLGGWAASRIVHVRQKNASVELRADAWSVQRVLPLSWLWNYSFLVRTPPLALTDGGMVVPVYFELGKLFPHVVRLDAEGQFRSAVRMTRQSHLLQPQLLPLDAHHWLALLRNGNPDRKIGVLETHNGGVVWQDSPSLTTDNPDAAVAALRLGSGHFVMAHNATTDSRRILDLSVSHNGREWQRLAHLAHSTLPQEFSYPALAWADNALWISYTDQRKRIAWQRFSVVPAPATSP
jgi:predicted neuraminidase